MQELANISLQPSFILHQRPYQENKFLAELLTKDYGRIGAVIRRPSGKHRRSSGVLQPFTPLLLSWTGKSDLKTIIQAEVDGNDSFIQIASLPTEYLNSGFYLNELLMRMLVRFAPASGVYELYNDTLKRLASRLPVEPILRYFEYRLLVELGYGFDWRFDQIKQKQIDEDQWYHFDPQHGFEWVHSDRASQAPEGQYFLGQWLENIAEGIMDEPQSRKAAKRILQRAIKNVIGNEPLKSRSLFKSKQ